MEHDEPDPCLTLIELQQLRQESELSSHSRRRRGQGEVQVRAGRPSEVVNLRSSFCPPVHEMSHDLENLRSVIRLIEEMDTYFTKLESLPSAP